MSSVDTEVVIAIPTTAMATLSLNNQQEAAPKRMEIVPLEPPHPFGAEVLGLDLSQDISEDTIATLTQALHKYLVLVIRGQVDATPTQQINFTARFGKPVLSNWGAHPDYPEITVVSNEVVDGKKLGSSGIPAELSKDGRRFHWHVDQHFKAEPAMATLLHARRLPECGDGDTLFASLYVAYDTLDEGMKAKLIGLKAGNSVDKMVKVDREKLTPQQLAVLDAIPPQVHPLVCTHPVTGRKYLFVSEAHTLAIEGMEPEESEALLQQLYHHSTRPDNVYSHKWKKGDLAFWDNRCLVHLATGSDHPRTLYRTMVSGTAPLSSA